jgi:hypothetical protein
MNNDPLCFRSAISGVKCIPGTDIHRLKVRIFEGSSPSVKAKAEEWESISFVSATQSELVKRIANLCLSIIRYKRQQKCNFILYLYTYVKTFLVRKQNMSFKAPKHVSFIAHGAWQNVRNFETLNVRFETARRKLERKW